MNELFGYYYLLNEMKFKIQILYCSQYLSINKIAFFA